ncbi:MAG TPA: response regulator transcription factor [Acidimicrobiales bacterium]|nr:response regulator transcription factor [Acidimicrobiales bacterium]
MAEGGEVVLVVDDDPGILQALSAALRARGLGVMQARTGLAALVAVEEHLPAAVILDLGLPDLDGIEVCRRLRQWTDVPIIVLTAQGAEDHKVQALDEGADDYVTKPFSTPELLARVRVALRHHRPRGEQSSLLRVGDIEVDVPRHRASVGGRELELTPKEFEFLAVLARQPGRVLTHRLLLEQVWGPGYRRETQYLRNYASQLRRKLDDDPDRPRLITEPGVGYRLVDISAAGISAEDTSGDDGSGMDRSFDR